MFNTGPDKPWWAQRRQPDKPWWAQGTTANTVPMPRDTNTQPWSPLTDPSQLPGRFGQVADLVPGVSDVKAALWDAPKNFLTGHPYMGLLSLATALPGVPGMGGGHSLGKLQQEAMDWISKRGGVVMAPSGDSVLNRLVEMGVLQKKPIRPSAITDIDVRDFGKSPGWRPRAGTWSAFEVVQDATKR